MLKKLCTFSTFEEVIVFEYQQLYEIFLLNKQYQVADEIWAGRRFWAYIKMAKFCHSFVAFFEKEVYFNIYYICFLTK